MLNFIMTFDSFYLDRKKKNIKYLKIITLF